MKKVFSISFVLLMLLAMLHLTVATHYCGGHVAALKVSLTGKLASCGMERDYTSTETKLFTHCCDDVVTFYAVDNNYTPSFPVVPNFYQCNLQVFNMPFRFPVISAAVLQSLYTNASPPGEVMTTSVDLSDICVFLI